MKKLPKKTPVRKSKGKQHPLHAEELESLQAEFEGRVSCDIGWGDPPNGTPDRKAGYLPLDLWDQTPD